MIRSGFAVGAALLLAACAKTHSPTTAEIQHQTTLKTPEPRAQEAVARRAAPLPDPAVLRPDRPLQCVPYARAASGIQIRGDAWTWWGQARGNYNRGTTPEPGAVVQLDTGPRRGHVAVVKRVLGPRKIVVDHANWLNHGQIHRNTPMIDISAANDWSRVRVWYTPGDKLGSSPYEVVGFIYPERLTAER